MTMDTWQQCAWAKCRKPFKPANRSNRYQYAKGQQHNGAKYCSNACKQAAYRLRLEIGTVEGRSTSLREAENATRHEGPQTPQYRRPMTAPPGRRATAISPLPVRARGAANLGSRMAYGPPGFPQLSLAPNMRPNKPLSHQTNGRNPIWV
jgi:hypothetical protein